MKKNLFRGVCGVVLFILASCSGQYHITKTERRQYPVNASIGADSVLIREYTPYKQKMDSAMNKVVGHAAILLEKQQGPESLLGNFFSDATFIESRKIDPTIDIAFTTTVGGIRASIAKGDVTLSDIFELMPFENELVVATVDAAGIQEMLNFVAASGGQPLSGVTMRIKDKQAVDIRINNAPLNVNKQYKVVTSDYLAGGGDSSPGFNKAISKKLIGLTVRDALLRYIQNLESAGLQIEVKLDGRIKKDK